MILSKHEFVARAGLDYPTLEVWIAEDWLAPSRTTVDLAFSELDLARAKLIRELIDDLGVNAEGVGLVLHLLDQVYGLRRAMADMLKAAHESAKPKAD